MNRNHNRVFIENQIGDLFKSNKIKYSILQDENHINISGINLGILTGFPIWSGYSISCGRKIIEEISQFLTSEHNWFEWIILDSDFVSNELYLEIFKVRKWGYFESIFIQNGDILKSYNSEKNLKEFIQFTNKQLELRNNMLTDNKTRTYNLSNEMLNHGIRKQDFTSEKRAIVNSNSKYKGEYLFELMKYDANGHYYVYEDDYLAIYDATRPTPLSSCFIDLKK